MALQKSSAVLINYTNRKGSPNKPISLVLESACRHGEGDRASKVLERGGGRGGKGGRGKGGEGGRGRGERIPEGG